MFGLAQELPQSTDAGIFAVPSSEVMVITDENATALGAELNNAKARIAVLKTTETITVLRHEELLERVKNRLAEYAGVCK